MDHETEQEQPQHILDRCMPDPEKLHKALMEASFKAGQEAAMRRENQALDAFTAALEKDGTDT